MKDNTEDSDTVFNIPDLLLDSGRYMLRFTKTVETKSTDSGGFGIGFLFEIIGMPGSAVKHKIGDTVSIVFPLSVVAPSGFKREYPPGIASMEHFIASMLKIINRSSIQQYAVNKDFCESLLTGLPQFRGLVILVDVRSDPAGVVYTIRSGCLKRKGH